MEVLAFVNDKELKVTLENSIEYIYALYEQSKTLGNSKLYREETHRVIILYVVAIIEAVLFYFYKERKEEIKQLEYKYIQELPKNYVNKDRVDSFVVIATREEVSKKDHQIGMKDLVTLFKNKKLIIKDTADKILELNELRNTFHLSKLRTKTCEIEDVEKAFKLLLYVLNRAPKVLKVNMS